MQDLMLYGGKIGLNSNNYLYVRILSIRSQQYYAFRFDFYAKFMFNHENTEIAYWYQHCIHVDNNPIGSKGINLMSKLKF